MSIEMSKLVNYFIFLVWISYLMTAGLLLFSNGYLLSRVSRRERGECTPCNDIGECKVERILEDTELAAATCLEPRAKVVLLIVDALKYDFVEWHNENDSSTDVTYYRNKLPVFHELAKTYPKYSRLYKFIADPPTTTMQRLTGLTTGSLPTFVDVGSNFATEDINEDNLIDQNAKAGVVFMGDDTWTALFPGRFLRQYPAPSFDVWDLDTVDREVRAHVFSEMRRRDWSLLVAHVLGVDHCGHKHGPNHPEMARKLNETNDLVKGIAEGLEEGTMLIVIGDHGMTNTGDHGGDSADEVEAAMFVYSTIPLLEGSLVQASETVNQVDLVPTLAAILGTPIPFSNIGSVILDSLPTRLSSFEEGKSSSFEHSAHPLHSLWRNIVQVKKFIDVYSNDTSDFPTNKLETLKQSFSRLLERVKTVNSNEEFRSFVKDARVYFSFLKEMCAEVWVQFNDTLIIGGLVLMFFAMFFSHIIFNCIPGHSVDAISNPFFVRCVLLGNAGTAILVLNLYWLGIIDEAKNMTFLATGVISILLFAVLILRNRKSISKNWYGTAENRRSNCVVLIVSLLTFFGLFSNSYVVEESRVLSFLLVTLVWLLLCIVVNCEHSENVGKKPRSFAKSTMRPKVKVLLVIMGLVATLAIRCSSYFWRCREEQLQRNCTTYVLGKAGSVISDSSERILLSVTMILLTVYTTILRIWMRKCGNLSGFSLTVLIASYCPGVMVLCTGFLWIIQRLPNQANIKLALSWQLHALPGAVYFLFVLGIIVLYCRPLTVYLLPKRRNSIELQYGENVVPRLFQEMKHLIYQQKMQRDEEVPIVYGLGTVYSVTYILFSTFLTLLYALLLGEILAQSTFAMFLTCASILGISAIERLQSANSITDLFNTSNIVILCWFMIAEYFFYGTGHQPTFPTIQWDAAFIGTGGHYYGNLIPAILIGINTFGSHIILGTTLPLLVVAPFTFHFMFPSLAKAKFHSVDDMKRGELLLYERDAALRNSVFQVSGKYMLFRGFKTFGCMLASTFLRRHLMVWKIFAPKLIFEGIGFMVTMGSVLASFLMLIRINAQVELLVTRLSKKS